MREWMDQQGQRLLTATDTVGRVKQERTI